MNVDKLTTVESLEDILQGNQAIAFSVLGDKSERYRFVQKILVKFRYITCLKNDKGIITRFLMKVTGFSRQQLARLIAQYKKTGRIEWKPCRSHGFARKFSEKDICLLAKTDEQHDTLCGHAVKNFACVPTILSL